MALLGGLLPTRFKGCHHAREHATVGRQGTEWANFQHTSLTAAGGELPALVAGGAGGIETGDALWVDGVDVRGA